MPLDLDQPVLQEVFAALVGISQPKVSQLITEGVIPRDGTAGQWLLAYCERLREQAAGRGQELSSERAALAKSQRVGQDIKNAVAQGEYAPIGLLSDVLAAAAAAVVDRFDALPGDLRIACPNLPEAARTQIDHAIASARNEWVRSTASLTMRSVELMTDDDDEQLAGADDEDDEPVST